MNSRLQKICVLLALLLVSAAAAAQNVTKTFKNTPLEAVLEEVESQTGYSLMYKIEDIRQAKPVSATFNDVSVFKVLDKVLGSSFTYSVSRKMISITKVDNPVPAARPAAAVQPQKEEMVNVSGKVVDGDGQPVIGAVVTIPGSPALGGVTTDFEGNFTWKAPKGSTVKVSCMGYNDVDKLVTDSQPWNIVLKEDSEMIEETIVVGYGVQKKESIVGAISQVTSEALVNSGQTNITHALAGKVAGMYTFQQGGQPGQDDAAIYIRGESSWNGSSPLVMVDGVERPFNELDPNEVESISVLKDASATAVFGAKGANGVILVTTKTGKAGKAKTHVSANFGLEAPTLLPEVLDAQTVLEAHNLGMKNDDMFGSLHSPEEIANYKSGANPLRYPDNQWYDLILKNFAPSTNLSYGVSGGTERVRYYLNVGYKYEGSIVKDLPGMVKNYSLNRINYRSNIDFDLTRTTVVSVKFGGYTKVVTSPGPGGTRLFTDIYNASTTQYPAFFPSNVLEMYPDPDYPDATGFRRSGTNGITYYTSPINAVADGDFKQSTGINLNTDLEVKQKLDFITKGLSLNGKISYATTFSRASQTASLSYPSYFLDWDAIDSGQGNPWIASSASTSVYVQKPYQISKSNTPSGTVYNFYWEASMKYDRKFGGHNVNAMALMYERNYVTGADFPSRTQSFVGRLNYNYKEKYLMETNIGITGSEQFAPQNRYGVFPSVAVGYYLSKEKFWKNAMPWWSTFKIRYSDGVVGSDVCPEKWLYFSAYERASGHITESAAANGTARWERAHKRDLGFEMGWFKDNLVLSVDLFNEDRTDILVKPMTTIFVVTDYKHINAGAIKKHGAEFELKYRNTTSGGLYYEIGGMLGLNENRIMAYEEAAYAPEYQKRVGKAYGSSAIGESLVDDKFFGTINSKHGYPGGNDNSPIGRDYKYLDYNADGAIDTFDRHPVFGSTIPPVEYSGHIALSYKGFSFDATLMGTHGKYIGIEDVYYIEFYKSDYLLHVNSMNYWTPTNASANHASLSTLYGAINKFGRSESIGTQCDIVDVLWNKSDYLTIKDVRLAYKLSKAGIVEKMGLKAATITLTGNNLYTFTSLKDADPEVTNLQNSYYPIMRNVKLGIAFDF